MAVVTGVCACSRPLGQDDRICATPWTIAAVMKAADAGDTWNVAEQCLHRTAYQVASAPGSSTEIGAQVMQACEVDILRNIAKPNTSPDDYRRHSAMMAAFYVTQARAGHCRIPL